MRRLGAIVLVVGLVLVAGGVLAQGTYPSKPIRVVVSFGPGGVTDILARLLAPEIQKNLGQPVVVENVAGATAIIGTSAVARAAPDGHTLLFTSNAHTINPALRKQLPFDTVKDFTPITLLAASPNMLIVRADSPIKSVADYIAAAKARPGEVTYAFSGVGTSLHIAGAQFAQITGTRYNPIPYKTSAESIGAVASGQTDSSWSAVNAALPFIKSGKVRALAVATEKRTSFAPEIPTFGELGVKGMKSETWLAVLAPANVPAPIAAKLSGEFMSLIARADMKERILKLGAEPVGIELEKFNALIKDEIDMYRRIVQAGGIKPE